MVGRRRLILYMLVFYSVGVTQADPGQENYIIELKPGHNLKYGDIIDAVQYLRARVDRRVTYVGRISSLSKTPVISLANATSTERHSGFEVELKSNTIRYLSKSRQRLIAAQPNFNLPFHLYRTYAIVITLKDDGVRVIANGKNYFDNKDCDADAIKNMINSVIVKGFDSGVIYVESLPLRERRKRR